jgi:alkylhydroperoxidase family enzyme
VNAAVDLLRRIAANDERSLRFVLSEQAGASRALDRVTCSLVQLAALLAADASTVSVRWAVETASTAGVDDAALVQVLVSSASTTGTAQTVTGAQRLAVAIDLDVDVDGWDGS